MDTRSRLVPDAGSCRREARSQKVSKVGPTLPAQVCGNAWQAGAAYLYLLKLNGSALAWEFLRRDPEYREAYVHRTTDLAVSAAAWNLDIFENPDLDGRCARPTWHVQQDTAVRLAKDSSAPPDTHSFSVWKVSGQPALFHDGQSLVLETSVNRGSTRIAIPADLSDGDRYALVIRIDADARRSWRAVLDCDEVLHGRVTSQMRLPHVPALRTDIAHMRSLQALDGFLSGASQREVAIALFGPDRADEGWHSDGDLRAQVRYLLRRGRALMCGGYLALVLGRLSQSSD